MKYATIWRRFWAAILDTLVLLPMLIFILYIKHHVQNSILLAGVIVINYSFANVYSIWMHSRTGQTFGKMVTNIRVLDEDEIWAPSLREAFMMNIGSVVYSVCTIGLALHAVVMHTYSPQGLLKNSLSRLLLSLFECWTLADIICIFCNRKHRSLHDLIAGTVVVRDRDYLLESGQRMQRIAQAHPEPPNVLG
jgi:uncharacterized RDD family membrane protein YckC